MRCPRSSAPRVLSTHSPSETRPGEIGRRLTQRFNELGYKVATVETPVASTFVIAEVYPHPALLHLLGKDFRFKYKIGRASEYWPEKTPADRRRRIVKNWRKIIDELSLTINKIELPLPAKTDLDNHPFDVAQTIRRRYRRVGLRMGWHQVPRRRLHAPTVTNRPPFGFLPTCP